MSGIVGFEKILWGLSVFLNVVLFALLLYRKNYRNYPYFLAYVLTNLLQSPVLFAAYQVWGYRSQNSANLAWGTQALVLTARALAVGEICRRVMGSYRGIWALAWRVLLAVAALILVYSLAIARHHWQIAVLIADRGVELAIAAVIVVVVLFARHYEIEVGKTDRSLMIGFFLLSCFAVLNNTLLEAWHLGYETLWNLLGSLAFIASLLVWAWAVRETQPATARRPEMLPSGTYRELAPEINLRLKLLNEQLDKFWYAEAKEN